MAERVRTVNDIMSTPRTVSVETPVTETAAGMLEEEIGSLVVTEGRKPVGIVTEADIVAVVADSAPESIPVSEIMSSPLLSIEAGATLEEAAQRMKAKEIKKLPVVNDGEFIGMVTTTDISHFFPQYHPHSASWIR